MRQELLEIIKKVHGLLRERGLSLSVAESCTGGLLSHYLTMLQGSSSFFKAGIICYSDEIKKKILGVSPEIIQTHGVVSEQMAREMAVRVHSLTKTDYSISTTGNLGPDVLEGKEKGLVYIAVCKEGRAISRELKLNGDRQTNNEEAVLSALRLLIEFIEDYNNI
jgi:PncC family amidohydrolase